MPSGICVSCWRFNKTKIHLGRRLCSRCRAAELLDSVHDHLGLTYAMAQEVIRVSLLSDREKDDALGFVLGLVGKEMQE